MQSKKQKKDSAASHRRKRLCCRRCGWDQEQWFHGAIRLVEPAGNCDKRKEPGAANRNPVTGSRQNTVTDSDTSIPRNTAERNPEYFLDSQGRKLTPEQRRQTMPDTGDENTVFAERGENTRGQYSINENYEQDIDD